MGICANQFRDFVVRPTLKHLGHYSKAAENLLLGTAAQESGLGFYFKHERQHGIGIYQISPQRHCKVWDHYLVNFPELASQIRGLASQHGFLEHPHAELATNLSYATAIAWMLYQQENIQLPEDSSDVSALAKIWARHFHHRAGGDKNQFIQNFTDFVVKQILVA